MINKKSFSLLWREESGGSGEKQVAEQTQASLSSTCSATAQYRHCVKGSVHTNDKKITCDTYSIEPHRWVQFYMLRFSDVCLHHNTLERLCPGILYLLPQFLTSRTLNLMSDVLLIGLSEQRHVYVF